MKIQTIKLIKKLFSKINNIADIYFYFEGNFRYKLYYSKYKWLIRQHIVEQIDYRVKMMNEECYNKGSCVECGCETIALQMCSKKCKGNCYPPLTNSKLWSKFIKRENILLETDSQGIWVLDEKTDEPIFYKETNTGYVPENFNRLRNYKSQ